MKYINTNIFIMKMDDKPPPTKISHPEAISPRLCEENASNRRRKMNEGPTKMSSNVKVISVSHRRCFQSAFSLFCVVILVEILSLSRVSCSPVFLNPENRQGPVSLARNIRHLPCISRRTGQEGVCMFAIDCLKANGSHLGTCIDRFYFGSCCQIADKNLIEPAILHPVDNVIDGSEFVPPSDELENALNPMPDKPLRKPVPAVPIATTERIDKTTIALPIMTSVKPDELTPITNDVIESKTEPSNSSYSTEYIDNSLSTLGTRNKTTMKPDTILVSTTTDVPVKLSTFQTVSGEHIKVTTDKVSITQQGPSSTTVKPTDAESFSTSRPQPKPTRKPVKPTIKPTLKPFRRPTPRPPSTSRPINNTANSTNSTTITKPSTSFNTTKKPVYRPPPKRPQPTKKPIPQPPRLNITYISSTTRPFKPIQTTKEPTTSILSNKTTYISSDKIRTTTSIPAANQIIENLPTTISKPITTSTLVQSTTDSMIQSTSIGQNKITPTTLNPLVITTTEVSSENEKPSVVNNTDEQSSTKPQTMTDVTAVDQSSQKTESTDSKTGTTTEEMKIEKSTEMPVIPTSSKPLMSSNVSEITSTSSTTEHTVLNKTSDEAYSTLNIANVSSTPEFSASSTEDTPPKPTASIGISTLESVKPISVVSNQGEDNGIKDEVIDPIKHEDATTDFPQGLVTWSNTVDTVTKIPVNDTDENSWTPITPPEGWILMSTLKPTPSPSPVYSPSTSNTDAPSSNDAVTKIPSMQPSTPSSQSSNPSSQSLTPSSQASNPSSQPSTPSSQPSTPSSQTSTPSSQPSTPSSQTSTPSSTTTESEPSDEYLFALDFEQPQSSIVTSPGVLTTVQITSSRPVEYLPELTILSNTSSFSPTDASIPEFTVNVTLSPTESPTTQSIFVPSSSPSPVPSENITESLVTTSSGNFSEGTTSTVSEASSVSSSTESLPQSPLANTTYLDVSTEPSSAANASANATSTVAPADSALNMTNFKDVCGRRLWPEARIVGGAKSGFGMWPWQISLRQWRTSTYLHKCGAALLNENWAITAAHCVEHVPPSELLVRLGEHDLANESEPYGFAERRVQIVASHPHFDPATFEYDLALLRFYEPVMFQPNILPVCVPDSDEDYVGKTAYVTGWGRLYDEGPLPSVLQEVPVPVINNTACEAMYRAAGYTEHIPNIFICAGLKKGGFDSCEGDSGGPMVLQRARDNRFVLGGIISWGIGCAEPNQPGVYTRISEFRDWINQILQF